MSFSREEQVGMNAANVVQLFGRVSEEIILADPLEELLLEAQIEDPSPRKVLEQERRLVAENQFPEQSMYILDDQLKGLRSSINRIKFYLGEIDDLLP